jgi:LPXTG-site transpeptidase (sortase) family protein
MTKIEWLLFVGITTALIFAVVSHVIVAVPQERAIDQSEKTSQKIEENIPAVEIVAGIPEHLRIPSIGVDAFIESAGLTDLGAMAVPEGPVNVAWFSLGPRPGAVGSAVIAGHYGWKNGINAVFDSLSQLKRGDEIYVQDTMGYIMSFVVSGVVIYGENDSTTAVFSSNDGIAHLNLITCGGVWNAKRKSYSERIVVFTDKK